MAKHDMTCGECGRTWNDRETPTPAARCPFEYDHGPSEREQIADAYKTNEAIAVAYFAMIDGDEEALRDHQDITVTMEPGDDFTIRSVEYDGSGPLYWPNEVRDQAHDLIHAWPAEIDCGFGRPLTILLSGGGPTEWIEAKLDSDGDVSEATLYASKGTADLTWKLSRTSALFRLAEYFAEGQSPEAE